MKIESSVVKFRLVDAAMHSYVAVDVYVLRCWFGDLMKFYYVEMSYETMTLTSSG